jgi:hypothetical protein
MGLISYDEDQSDMFLRAIEDGFVKLDPRLIVDLEPHHNEEFVLQWCNEQWSTQEVLTCIATFCHEVSYPHTTFKTREYHYVSRYFFKNEDHAMLFKLVFSDGLVTLPPGTRQLFLR